MEYHHVNALLNPQATFGTRNNGPSLFFLNSNFDVSENFTISPHGDRGVIWLNPGPFIHYPFIEQGVLRQLILVDIKRGSRIRTYFEADINYYYNEMPLGFHGIQMVQQPFELVVAEWLWSDSR